MPKIFLIIIQLHSKPPLGHVLDRYSHRMKQKLRTATLKYLVLKENGSFTYYLMHVSS